MCFLRQFLKQSQQRVDAFMSPVPLASLPTVEDVFDSVKKGVAPAKQVPALTIETVPPPPEPPKKDDALEALQAATQKRFEQEAEKLAQLHQYQLRQKEVEIWLRARS